MHLCTYAVWTFDALHQSLYAGFTKQCISGMTWAPKFIVISPDCTYQGYSEQCRRVEGTVSMRSSTSLLSHTTYITKAPEREPIKLCVSNTLKMCTSVESTRSATCFSLGALFGLLNSFGHDHRWSIVLPYSLTTLSTRQPRHLMEIWGFSALFFKN